MSSEKATGLGDIDYGRRVCGRTVIEPGRRMVALVFAGQEHHILVLKNDPPRLAHSRLFLPREHRGFF